MVGAFDCELELVAEVLWLSRELVIDCEKTTIIEVCSLLKEDPTIINPLIMDLIASLIFLKATHAISPIPNVIIEKETVDILIEKKLIFIQLVKSKVMIMDMHNFSDPFDRDDEDPLKSFIKLLHGG